MSCFLHNCMFVLRFLHTCLFVLCLGCCFCRFVLGKMTTMRSRLRSKEVWKKGKVLGSGTYGMVHLAHQCGCSDGPLAVKSALATSYAAESLKWEGGVMRQLIGAPNVVECYGDDVSNGVYSLLLEYAPCGTLRDLIGSSSPMDELHVACYAAMLLNGLFQVHSRGYIHCDLKPSNILVFPGSSPVIKQLKIADFGVSEAFGEDKENIPFDSNSLESEPASPSSDILALGCILCQMIGGRSRMNANLDEIKQSISPDAKDFLLTCLLKKPNAICTARELLKHPFIETNLNIMSDRHGVGLKLDVDGPELGVENASAAWISQRNLFAAKPASLPMSCRRSLAGNSMKPIHFR